jgi:hypothetical protein
MKKLLTIILLFALGWNSNVLAQESVRPQTPEELAKAVFKTLKEDDHSSYLSLILDKSDVKILVENADVPDSVKASGAEKMWSLASATRQNSKSIFDATLKQINEKGFDWTEAEVDQVLDEIESRNGLEHTEIFFSVKSGDKTYTIRMPLCYKSDAWLMFKEIELKM